MSEPGFVEIISALFEERFGGWQQPDLLDPCRTGLGGCPVQWTDPYELRKVSVLFSRNVGTAPPQDAAMFTIHLLNLTGGSPDATWTTGDYTAAESLLDAWWTAQKPNHTAEYVLAGYRWQADGPAFRPHTPAPGGLLSPTLRNTARTVAGTGATPSLPPQVAISVTEVTPAKYTALDVEGSGDQLRNRWGRFYLPAPITLACEATGRLIASVAGGMADSVQTLYNGLVAADLIPVMYSPTTGSSWAVSEIHVDDIFDVIRSRRFRTPLTRAPRTITAP